MNKKYKNEFDERMCETYPVLYKDRFSVVYSSCMDRGFDIHPGWYDLVEDCSEKLQVIMDNFSVTIIAQQVKQKFGGLRFYYRTEISETYKPDYAEIICGIIGDIVSTAEKDSEHICEVCGDSGIIREGTHVLTLCDKHFADYKEKSYKIFEEKEDK